MKDEGARTKLVFGKTFGFCFKLPFSMPKFILGRKLGMTQVFDQKGKVTPVTIIEAGPCFVVAIRTPEKHGYSALQLNFALKIHKELTKHPKKNDILLREFRLPEAEAQKYKVGDQIAVANFQEGEQVKAAGVSHGKGFQGVVKRWGFKGSPATHGHKHDERAPGSIGATFPEKVIKGMRMAGRMGGKRITAKGLTIINIDAGKNLMAVKGAVPGVRGGLVEVRGEE